MSSWPALFPFVLDDTTTLLDLERLVASEIGYAQGQPSSAGTSTTIVDVSGDSALDSTQSTKLVEKGWLKIEEDTNGQNVGEVRRISGAVASTGTFTVSRAYSNATATTMTYGVYLGLPPDRWGTHKGISEYVNEILRNLEYRNWYLLTLCQDGDMEASGTASWTGANSTLTKVTSNVTAGKQALRVENSAANGYAQSQPIAVQPSRTVEVIADVTPSSGTADLILWDYTNSAEINSYTTADRHGQYIWLQETAPATCKQVTVRLAGVESDADIYWDNVTVRTPYLREIALPSWYIQAGWLEEVLVYGGGSAGSSGNVYDAAGRDKVSIFWWSEREDHGGDTPYKVQFYPSPPLGCHMFAQVVRPYTQLTSDSATTGADPDWVKAWVLARIYADMGDKEKMARWKAEADVLHRKFQPKFRKRRMMSEVF